jgi:anti-sigma factor RsiW
LNCTRARKLLSAYLDRELSGSEMLAVRGHVCNCSGCDLELEALRKTRDVLARGQEPSEPPGLEERLLSQVFREEVPQLMNRPRVLWASGIALAAVAGSLFAVAAVRDSRQRDAEARAALELRTQEMARDQAYFEGTDPLAGGNGLIPVSYGQQ